MLIWESNNSFTKRDLSVGMLVEYKNGLKRMVMPNCFVDKHGTVVAEFKMFNDDLTHKQSDELNINKVYSATKESFDFECKHRKLINERKEGFKVGDIVVRHKNFGFEQEKNFIYKVVSDSRLLVLFGGQIGHLLYLTPSSLNEDFRLATIEDINKQVNSLLNAIVRII